MVKPDLVMLAYRAYAVTRVIEAMAFTGYSESGRSSQATGCRFYEVLGLTNSLTLSAIQLRSQLSKGSHDLVRSGLLGSFKTSTQTLLAVVRII